MIATVSHMTAIEDFADALSELLNEAADVFLEDLPGSLITSSDSPWARDRAAWTASFDSDDVAGWVSETSAIYLAEAARLLRGHATLLQTRSVFATIDVIVRAIIERVGHANWILDHQISARQRSARAGLELAVCFYMYRENLHLLDASQPHRRAVRAEARLQQRQLKEWFAVVQPPEDECDDDSPPTGDVRRWIVDSESFPTLTQAATFAMERGGIVGNVARGVYASLSGFSHPNVVFSREHRDIDELGHITFRYERPEMENAEL